MDPIIFGIIGGAIIVLAWAVETVETIRYRKNLDLTFSTISFIGVLALIAYSLLINDPVFIWLNIAIAALIAIEIYFSFKLRKKK